MLVDLNKSIVFFWETISYFEVILNLIQYEFVYLSLIDSAITILPLSLESKNPKTHSQPSTQSILKFHQKLQLQLQLLQIFSLWKIIFKPPTQENLNSYFGLPMVEIQNLYVYPPALTITISGSPYICIMSLSQNHISLQLYPKNV